MMNLIFTLVFSWNKPVHERICEQRRLRRACASAENRQRLILLTAHIRPSANKDSNGWGQDISKSISKSMANTSLSSCIFKTMGSKENKLKILWWSGVPSRSYQYLNIAKSKKNLGFVWQTFKITLYYLDCCKSLLFISYLSMSISSVTICSTRNDKRFETRKLYVSYYCQPQTKSHGQHDV